MRRTVRFRLAVRYTALFLISSSVILVISFGLVAHSLSTLPTRPSGHQINNTLTDVLLFSLLGLGGMAVISGGLGWLMAGRILRPVREITNTARRASEESLAERVGLEGPPDELKELADTFDAMLDRLDAAFASQRSFIANASHELRTPLTAMLTAIEVTLGKADRTSAQLEAMAELVRLEVERSNGLIDALLTLARSQRGTATNEYVDLATACEDSLDAATNRIEDRHLEVTCALEPAELVGDRLLLERMVGNVIDNATRHCDREGWIRVSSGRRDNTVFVEVVNSGESIENDVVPSLLEPFRRSNSRVGDAEGAGLGLAIVNAVATSHHGTVALNGRVGGGLEILVQLPIQTNDVD
jgi:signal transduction histidine kinase